MSIHKIRILLTTPFGREAERHYIRSKLYDRRRNYTDFLEKSLEKENTISNDYSVEGETVILTDTRCIHEFDIGKGLVANCRLHVDDI